MNENHQRHLVVTFQHVDRLLSEAEQILNSIGSPSLYQEYSPDATPVQRKVVHDYILRVREIMRRILADLDVRVNPPISGALWAVRSHVSFTSIAIAEIEPKLMAGYGRLSQADEATLNKIVAELNATIDRLGVYLAQGPDAELQTRLKRLDQTHDEVKLLRDLERIITTHGLVEFRSMLALLLGRLETDSFEIGIFGRVNSGKSSLLNHLLGGEFLPIGVTPVTAVPTRIRFGPQPQAMIEFAEGRPQIIEITRLGEFCTEQQNPDNTKHVSQIRLEIPARTLREGVTFVDTPGLGSLATSGAEETVAYLPRCDFGILLVDASVALSYEDLSTVQALYQSGATATVLVTKSDLLTLADRERVSRYIRQHLLSKSNLDLSVRMVSVVGADARLCDEWFEQELRPLLESHQKSAAASLERKVGGLREAVIRALQQRIEGAQYPPPSSQDPRQAIESLRNAHALLESAQRNGYLSVREDDSIAAQIIEAATDDLVAAWRGADGDAKATGEIFSAALTRVVFGLGTRQLDALVKIRNQLSQSLQLAAHVLHVAQSSEELPRIAELPIVDPASLSRVLRLEKPRLLNSFGKTILRSYIHRQLRKQLAAALPAFLTVACKNLRKWYQTKLSEMAENFSAREAIYSTQFEQRGNTTTDDADIRNDIDILKELDQPDRPDFIHETTANSN